MAMRLRSLGEMDLASGEKERVRCWKCQRRFEVPRTARRGACPECGSEVALHRLQMPQMPSAGGKAGAGKKGEVIRLEEVVGMGGKDHHPGGAESGLEGMTMLENGEPASRSDRRRRTFGSAERRPFEASRQIEARRRALFQEAPPRMDGVRDGSGMGGLGLKLLMVAIAVLVTLVLLAVALTLWGV